MSRPAVVVSREAVGPDGLLLWTAMITNAERDAWPGDITIENWEALGLIIPSKVRTAKISAAKTASAVRINRLPEAVWREVRDRVRATIA